MNAPLPDHVLPKHELRLVPAAMLAALRERFGERCSTATAVREQHGRDESTYPIDAARGGGVLRKHRGRGGGGRAGQRSTRCRSFPSASARRSKATCWRCRAASASTWAA